MDIQVNPKIIAARRTVDLHDALGQLHAQPQAATGHAQRQIALAQSDAGQGAFLRVFEASALLQARQADARRQQGMPAGRLAGLGISIKDLFDVAGQPATGGSRVLDGQHSALCGLLAAQTPDSAAVARLRAAGASFTGHTQLSEFAFSGLGLNPHHGTPANPVTAVIDPVPRIPGGSTSGGAVSVAIGASWAALGSDTGGSIRIPAALQGLVGFKNTQHLTPRDGCIPLSTTLDTACAITLSVRDAVLLHEVLADRTVRLSGRPLHRARFAVPTDLMLEQLAPAVAQAFERSLAALRAAGAEVVMLALPELAELSQLNAQGGFSAAESWAWHRARLARHAELYDPRVALRIRRGERLQAADYLDLLQARQDWCRRVSQRLRGFDAALSPTVPLTAPPLQPLLDDDTLFFQTNALMLRNPAVVNFLDGCALTLPCQQAGELPVGLMLWSVAGQDDVVLDLGLAAEACLHAAGAR